MEFTILKNVIILVFRVSKFSHRLFRLTLIRSVIQVNGTVPRTEDHKRERQVSS
jgi:hypothetical protein